MKHYGRWLIAAGVMFVLAILIVVVVFNYRGGAHGSLPVNTVSDGHGGVIIAWESTGGIFAQHVDAAGKPLWQPGGVTIASGNIKNDPYAPPWSSFLMVSDGAGGAIIAWDDMVFNPPGVNNPPYFNPVPIFIRRVNASGQLLWDKSAVAAGGNWKIIADGDGGAIVAWDNFKPYFKALHDDFLCLQKIAPDGTRLWGGAGLSLIKSSPFHAITQEEIDSGIKGTISRNYPTYAGNQDIISDGDGGAIVIWQEDGLMAVRQVYATRINRKGPVAWADNTDKIMVGNGEYQRDSLRAAGSDGFSLAYQTGDQGPIFQQQVSGSGELSKLSQYYPNAITDGAGGTIAMHIDTFPPFTGPTQRHNDLNVQRLDKEGTPLWPEKQVLSTRQGYQIGNFKYDADGSGGVILSWQLQNGHFLSGPTYVQRVDADGNLLFGDTGMKVFGTADNYQGSAAIFSDGSGGVFVAGVVGNGANSGNMVTIQHINAGGNQLWGSGIRLDK